MPLQKSFIALKNVRIFGYHGVLPEERVLGTYYVLNVRIAFPVWKAVVSDDVKDTLNYAEVNDILHSEMAKPSNLIEHVAGRILTAIENQFPAVSSIEFSIRKENPPMQGECAGAEVTLYKEYK